jgi:hypothetical protein
VAAREALTWIYLQGASTNQSRTSFRLLLLIMMTLEVRGISKIVCVHMLTSVLALHIGTKVSWSRYRIPKIQLMKQVGRSNFAWTEKAWCLMLLGLVKIRIDSHHNIMKSKVMQHFLYMGPQKRYLMVRIHKQIGHLTRTLQIHLF